jgi:hypothetical protein
MYLFGCVAAARPTESPSNVCDIMDMGNGFRITTVKRCLRNNGITAALVLLILIPAFLPTLALITSTPDDKVPVPVYSFRHASSDNPYYAAFTREAMRGQYPLANPFVESDHDMSGHVELFKSVNHWFSAWPALFTDDTRLVITIGLYSSFFLTCLFLNKIFLQLGTGRMLAMALTAVLFYGHTYQVPLLIDGIIDAFEADTFSTFTRRLELLTFSPNTSDFMRSNQNWRLLICSTSNFVVLAWTYGCLRLLRYPRNKVALVFLVVISFLLVYTYLLSAVFLACLMILPIGLFLGRRRRAALSFALCGLITAVLLVISGFPWNYARVTADSPLIQAMMQSDRLLMEGNELYRQMRLRSYWKYGIPWLITFAIAIPCSIFVRRRFMYMFIAIGLVFGACLIGLYLRDDLLIGLKIMTRGMTYPWSALLLGIIAMSLRKIWIRLTRRKKSLAPRWSRVIAGVASVLLLLAVMGGAFAGFQRWARHLRGEYANPYLISRDQWNALEWLRTQVPPDQTVLCSQWEDITLLPVYTDCHVYYGHWQNNDRPRGVEIRRFLAGQKLLGLKRADFSNMLDQTLRARMSLIRHQRKYLQIQVDEKTPREQHRQAMFSMAILYWPYVFHYDDITISAEPEKLLYGDKNLSPAFKERMLQMYDRLDAFPEDDRPEYILLDRDAFDLLPSLEQQGAVVAYRNPERIVLRVTDDFPFALPPPSETVPAETAPNP